MLNRFDIDTPKVRQHLADKLKEAQTAQERRIIIRALQHISAGGFGYCTTCYSPIPADVLERFPGAERCPDCICCMGVPKK